MSRRLLSKAVSSASRIPGICKLPICTPLVDLHSSYNKSLIYTRNINGLSTQTWQTPWDIFKSQELTPANDTNYLLSK